MNKFIIGFFALFLLVACSQETPTGQLAQEPLSPGTVLDQEDAGTENPGAILQEDGRRVVEVNVNARNWEFEPSEIRVKRGDLVRITLTTEDVAHGIAIEGYAESLKLGAQETGTFEFVADKSGEFRFYCNVFCGQGHREMAGQLIVEE